MIFRKAYIYKRFQRAVKYLKHSHMIFDPVFSETIPCPSYVEVEVSDLKGYMDLSLFKRIKRKTRDAELPVQVSGSWSKGLRNIDLETWYRRKELNAHFLDGVAWNDLPSVKKKRRRLDEGYYVSDARSHEILDKRLSEQEELFNTINKEGRLSSKPEHLVSLSISESGDLYWGPGGQHRIAIALVVGIHTIPMRLAYVHTNAVGKVHNLIVRNRNNSYE